MTNCDFLYIMLAVSTNLDSAGLTPRRQGRPEQLETLVPRIVRGSGRVACRGRQSRDRDGTAQSTRVVVESRVVLRRGAQSAQRGSHRKRALAGCRDVDGARVVSNLQPLVPWARECSRDGRVRHCTVCDNS
jgi:hypothetical protein